MSIASCRDQDNRICHHISLFCCKAQRIYVKTLAITICKLQNEG